MGRVGDQRDKGSSAAPSGRRRSLPPAVGTSRVTSSCPSGAPTLRANMRTGGRAAEMDRGGEVAVAPAGSDRAVASLAPLTLQGSLPATRVAPPSSVQPAVSNDPPAVGV